MEAEAGEAKEAEDEEGEEAERPLQGTWAPRIGVRVTAEAAALAGALAASAEDLVQLERRRQVDAAAEEEELKQAQPRAHSPQGMSIDNLSTLVTCRRWLSRRRLRAPRPSIHLALR